MKISIIIPAYNEEKRIGDTLRAYGDFFNKTKIKNKINYEILVIINNTKDKTEDVVKIARKKNKNIKYLNFKRGGKGFAIMEGFKDALKRQNDFIGFVDADMATSPECFFKLVKNIKDYDGIIASRHIEGSKINLSLKRKIISFSFNLIVRVLFFVNYKDTQCGAKLFRRTAIEKVLPLLGVTAWAFDVDLLYQTHKSGFKIKEWPTIWMEKTHSKIDLRKDSIKMLFAILQLRLLNSPMKKLWKIMRPFAGTFWKLIR
jgi:glycosyltransferase involved in cell wall biosynthesis